MEETHVRSRDRSSTLGISKRRWQTQFTTSESRFSQTKSKWSYELFEMFLTESGFHEMLGLAKYGLYVSQTHKVLYLDCENQFSCGSKGHWRLH